MVQYPFVKMFPAQFPQKQEQIVDKHAFPQGCFEVYGASGSIKPWQPLSRTMPLAVPEDQDGGGALSPLQWGGEVDPPRSSKSRGSPLPTCAMKGSTSVMKGSVDLVLCI